MKSLELVRLTFRGFSGYKEERTFEFGPENEIIGDNYEGKTTIGEGVIYALAGVDREAKSGKDGDMINDQGAESYVALRFRKDGAEHEVVRQAVKAKGKTTTTVFMDGIKTTQEKIDAAIGDRKYLMAAFMPQYFLQLEPKTAREVLMTLLPIPDDEEIRERIGEHDSELLGTNPIIDTDYYIKNRQTELKEFEDEVKELQGAAFEVERGLKIEKILDPIDEDPHKATVQALQEAMNAIQQAKPQVEPVDELRIKRQALLTEYETIQKGLKFEEKLCPNCGHNLSADQEAENERITDRMNEIADEGKRTRTDIEATEARNKKAAEDFERDNGQTLQALQQQIAEAQEELRKAQEHNADVRALQKQRDKAIEREKTLVTDQAAALQRVENMKAKIQAAKQYVIAKTEIAVEKIEQQLDHVSIRLFDIVKSSGEIKPIFKCDYKGKPYHRLSTSEGIRAGLEIARLFRALTKTKYPVFIDYAESITHYDQPETQIITARVIKGQRLTFNGEVVA